MELLVELEKRRVIKSGHFRLSSGLHTDTYFNLTALTSSLPLVNEVAAQIAAQLSSPETTQCSVIVSPTEAGVIYGLATALYMSMSTNQIAFAYISKSGKGFRFKRGQEALVRGKKVAVIDDVITTAKTLSAVARAITRVGGKPTTAVAVLNRGMTDYEKIVKYYPNTFALVCVNANVWDAPCPLCLKGVPLNTDLGHQPSS